jgi:imidazole glycerol-phosphate synthase subunit HisH
VIVVVDYGMGNVGSMLNMLKKAGARAVLSGDPADIAAADRLILPGVGAFDAGMRQLRDRGLLDPLQRKVVDQKTPILGVCLGMQLFTSGSEEGGEQGLGWVDGTTVRFHFDQPSNASNGLRIPHMGWNQLTPRQPHPLIAALPDEPRFYFVHSYHLRCRQEEDVVATTWHGYEFPSVIGRDNVMGTQFHPEKSHRFGLALLKAFAERC